MARTHWFRSFTHDFAVAGRPLSNRPRLLLETLEDRSVPATLSNFLTSGHADLNLTYSGGPSGTWNLQPRDVDNDVSYAPDDAVLYVGTSALTTRPGASDFDFIGVGASADFYKLPQTQDPNLLYLGIAGFGVTPSEFDRYNPSAESGGRVSGLGRWLKMSLLDVHHTTSAGAPGNGVLSVWQSGDTVPAVFMSSYNDGIAQGGLDTTDGITANDSLWVVAGGHIHFNYGFTQPGRYEVTVKLSGYLGDDGASTPNTAGHIESAPLTVYFSVGNVGQVEFDSSSYTVNEAAGTASVAVRRFHGSDGRITVNYAASDGSALVDADYTAASGTFIFNDLETVKTVTIPILNDGSFENGETVNLTLSAPGPTSIATYVSDPNADNSSLLGTQSTSVLTIDDDDSASPPIANDDAFAVSATNSVRGNVLTNDANSTAGTLTATLLGSPTHGSVNLDSNGSFVYTPGPTFAGSDTFTYTATNSAAATDTATVAIAAAVTPSFEASVGPPHADIGVNYENDAWDLHIHDHATDQEYEPDQASYYVGNNALSPRPAGSAFDFIGVASGAPIYRLPQSVNPELLSLGLGAEELAPGMFEDGRVTLYLRAVDGPGQFTGWNSTDAGPVPFFVSSDGITDADTINVLELGHDEYNWGFTAPGLYAVTIEAVGILTGTTSLTSGVATYYFTVDDSPTATLLTATPNASTGGNLVTYTATVSPSPGVFGAVTFKDAGVPLVGGEIIPLVDGVARFQISTLTAAIHPITADYSGAPGFAPSTSNQIDFTVTASPPQVLSVIPNGNIPALAGVQRSLVASLAVRFNQPVQLDADALTLTLHDNVTFDGIAGPFGSLPTDLVLSSDDNITWVASFSGNTDPSDPAANGFQSLRDGVYDLNVDPAKVHPLGVPGVNGSTIAPFTFHRLFGDATGEELPPVGNSHVAVVAIDDNFAFRSTFANSSDYRAYFDFDGDANIGVADNFQFRSRFNRPLTWSA